MECRENDSLNALLTYAVNRRDSELIDGELNNVIYWNGYIDGIKRAMEVNR